MTPPRIEWQRSFGGTSREHVAAVRLTDDGGYVIGGSSGPPASGNSTNVSFGSYDYWVVRLDGLGNKLWERTYGGTDFDYLADVLLLPDGGLLLGGSTRSGVSGNKTSPALGDDDFWIVRTDASGAKLWDRSYGTTNSETLRSMQRLPDGGFVLSGDVQYHSTPADWWILRIDSVGNVVWERTLGGSQLDQAPVVRVMPNGDICLAGQSQSPISGDKTSAGSEERSFDYWLVRLDRAGNKLWDKTYWGIGTDYLFGLEATSDGGLLLGGSSTSPPSGNKESAFFGEYLGFGDYWVVRVDGTGELLWEKSFGGSGAELYAQGLQTADGGYFLGGTSSSPVSGNKTAPVYGNDAVGQDYWVVRLNKDGEKLWEESYGGSSNDWLEALAQTPDGGLILAGESASRIDGNKTVSTFGIWEIWVVKLAPDALSLPPRLRASPQSQSEIQTSGRRMMLEGISNQNYVIEYSADQKQWLPMQTNRLSHSSLELFDASTMDSSRRFYRARAVP